MNREQRRTRNKKGGYVDSITKKWRKELDAAVLSFNVEKFRRFYKKWKALGIYQDTLPADPILEISLRKMALNLRSASPLQKLYARKWLKERGYSDD